MKCFVCEKNDIAGAYLKNKVIFVICPECGKGTDEKVEKRVDKKLKEKNENNKTKL